MRFAIPNPDGRSVIELATRTDVCVAEGCGGAVVRHSLGGGQSVDRCTRCFRRYQTRARTHNGASGRGRLRLLFREFVTWREDERA
jgi:hypothetical protein